ncbi:hypothetical protein [Pseudogemmobacter humi]|uniref:Uncharacterized protein n=1 Tax=Pseudogemmobacter humi TaxID=2483812 RepID=A0A3P5XBE7_9RHOB|nr:hypothetical protein [Pseudogemmobacter humi]VDC31993.1 hypothetical protein XINFAN_03262 [Pseudogemmobacter humi]
MEILIWTGALISLLGLGGLVWCVLRGLKIRRSGADEARMRSELQRLFAVNFAALGVSALGLALVVAGIALG